MRKLILIFLILGFFKVQAQKPESILFTVGDDAVTLSEFLYIYEKNNKNDDNYYSPESVKEYLDLFIKFKLKVKEAEALGIDTSKAFRDEFKTYRDQLTKPYLTDKDMLNKLVKEGYERMNWELRASHILIKVNEDAPPEEVEKAREKIEEVYKLAKKGEDFDSLALKYSEDPSVKHNKGDLGYFSAFHLIYKFEDKAYNTPVGEVSEPFRTMFGFHILKLHDKRPYQGQIKVAQIYVSIPQDAGPKEKNAAKTKIDSIYAQLEKGVSFKKLVEMHSDDKRSKNKGGEIPEFTNFTFSIPKEFKKQAFQLENNGDYSEPFQTNVGWHIIKRIKLTPLKPFKEMEDQIRTKVKKDSRAKLSEASLIEKIQEENHFKLKNRRLKQVKAVLDSNLLEGKWEIPADAGLDKWLFRLGKEEYTQMDFAEYMQNKQKMAKFNNLDYAFDKYWEEYIRETVLDYADRHLEEHYPEFRNLVNEYKEGMMLFEITDEMVWSKAMNDTTGQKEYYESHQTDYMWKKRVDAVIFICKDKSIAKQVVSKLKDGIKPDKIASQLNEEDPLNISYSLGTFEEGENEYLEKHFGKTGIFKLKEDENGNWRVIHMKKYYEPEPKKFKEIRGIVIADYQNFLEKQWIKELKEKYPVKIYDEVLETILNK